MKNRKGSWYVTFQGKKKATWNEDISKKKNTKIRFPPQGKEVFNSYKIGKSWFDHEEDSWNLQSCNEKASDRKIVISDEDVNYDKQESYSDYDQYANDATNAAKLNGHLAVDAKYYKKQLIN